MRASKDDTMMLNVLLWMYMRKDGSEQSLSLMYEKRKVAEDVTEAADGLTRGMMRIWRGGGNDSFKLF